MILKNSLGNTENNMPKETKPFPGWPDNPYKKEKYKDAFEEHYFPEYASHWQEASDACAKAVKERDAEIINNLENLHSDLACYPNVVKDSLIFPELNELISKLKENHESTPETNW
ncbi:hypothetical protein KAR91_63805 [Candidatus Pacearchaeota archaeon]|nr:hypothetical protein [Candidatus Pacearchaeota archaeon]